MTDDAHPAQTASESVTAGGKVAAAPVRGRGPWWRRFILTGLVVVVAVLPLWLRVGIEGRLELARADQARTQDAPDREIEHLGRALRWRAPLLDHDERALDRLWALARQQQQRGPVGREGALMAYREVRRGLLATRAWDIPHREHWEQANAQIAVLMAQQEHELGFRGESQTEAQQHHRARLQRISGPDPIRAALASLAFVGWIAAVVGFAWRGLDRAGRLRPRPALRWGLGALFALVAWTVLLAVAHPAS